MSGETNWRDYAVEKPPAEGIYEWRVPSFAVSGLIVRSLAHNRTRGAGHKDAISPAFDYWDGYNLHVPPGTQWREPPEGVKLERYEQRLVCAEGVEFEPCPFCKNEPKLKGYVRASNGGAVVTSDAHRINHWWLECCAWARSPYYSDPRVLAETRKALLSKAVFPMTPAMDEKGLRAALDVFEIETKINSKSIKQGLSEAIAAYHAATARDGEQTSLGTGTTSSLLSDVDRVSDSPGVREAKESTPTNQDVQLCIAMAMAADRGCLGGLSRADFDVASPKSKLGVAWHDAGIALRALKASQEAEVVKALEWAKHPAHDLWRAQAQHIGWYGVAAIVSPASWSFDGLDEQFTRDAESADDAKAAAQSDFEARIRSCLATAQPSPDADGDAA